MTGHASSVNADKVNLAHKLALFTEIWSPRTIADLNDYELKVVKVKGEFPWHQHEETDELFLVLKGRLTIRMRDGDAVLDPGELFVVPRRKEHSPYSEAETHILLIEPRGIVNTGDAGGDLTARSARI